MADVREEKKGNWWSHSMLYFKITEIHDEIQRYGVPFQSDQKKKPPQEICFDKVFFSPIISFYFSAVFEYIEWRFLFTIHYVINVACIPECNIFFDESNENNEEKRPYLHFPLVFLTVRISHELMYSLNDNREGF